MNAISESEVMATACPPSPLLSQEPSSFWIDKRCVSPLSMAREASALSSGAPSCWAANGLGTMLNMELKIIKTTSLKECALIFFIGTFRGLLFIIIYFLSIDSFSQLFVVVLKNSPVFQRQLTRKIFIQCSAVSTSKHFPFNTPSLGTFSSK